MATANPFQFSTHYTDEQTGLVYAKQRYYLPTTGRWLSRDPIGERGSLNLYGYVSNNSINLFDPFGLASLVNEDPYLSAKRAEVAKVDGSKSIYEALIPIGIAMKDVLSAMQLEQRTTGRLLREPSAVALVLRMAETNAVRSVHLAGLLAFFERGGRIGELDAANESAFEKRMGKDTRGFHSPALQIRYLSSEHLLALVEVHSASSVRASFLTTALD
ncbi:MAG: hypothetical protein JWQ44_2075 [Chthoniobacter sp.]|jgi:RHS repeat-associated protein|nr:hypothetical protein [Chthoniobacter sp.]